MANTAMAVSLMTSSQQKESRIGRVGVDPLSLIYNETQWRFSKVSALSQLQYTPVRLKQYASKIKQAIVSQVSSIAITNYTVIIESDAHLKYSEEDSDALLISVSTCQSENNAKPKLVYEGLLISWGMSNSVPDAVHLPYLLERGEQKIATTVKAALGTMFDCKINQFNFTQQHLLNFGLNFIETETSHFDKRMAFKYNIPDTKDNITVNLEIGDVYMIWNGLKEKVTRKSELVNLTYQSLQNQIFFTFVLDITTMDLYEVTLPKAAVKSNGTIKMKTAEVVNCVFTVLNEISTIDAV